MKNQKNIGLFIILFALISACKDEVLPENPPQNETELITTMQLVMKDSATGLTSTFTFKDPDGEGGQGPTVFDTIHLVSGKVYQCELLLLDESKSITDTISNEVKAEGNDHLVFYDVVGPKLSISITDFDSKQLPLGLKSRWHSTQTGQGLVTVQLKHQPGQKDGSRTPGETDAMVTYPIIIE